MISTVISKVKQHKELLLFGGVGMVGTVVNMALLWALTQAGMHYLAASAIATEAAILTNFTGNQYITFSHVSNGLSLTQRFLSFQFISLSTILGTMAILWALTTAFGESLILVWNLIAIGTMFLVNYGLNASVTWRKGAATGFIVACLTVGAAVAAPATVNASTANNTTDVDTAQDNVTTTPNERSNGSVNVQNTNISASTNGSENEELNTSLNFNSTETTNLTINSSENSTNSTGDGTGAADNNTSVYPITSTPSGVKGSVNGTNFTTPANVTMQQGLQRIRLSKDGFDDTTRSINVTGRSTLAFVLNRSRRYILEGQSISFTANTTGNVTWTVGNETQTTAGAFTWTPSIFYTDNTAIATVRASTGEAWNVVVRDVANPYFSSNNGKTVLHVITNNAVDRYRNVTVTLVNGDRHRNVTLEHGGPPGGRTDWTRAVSLRPGTTFARTLYLKGNTSRRFDLGDARGTYTETGGGEEEEEESADYSVEQDRALPTLVSALFGENIVGLGEPVTVSVDAKNFNGGVTRVEALLRLPDGGYVKKNLNRTGGSEEYGTWTASVTPTEKGEYTLQSVSMWTGDISFTELVPNRKFYAGGDTERRNLELVYTTLSQSDASVGDAVTLTLDAADTDGVDTVTATVNKEEGASYTVPLNVTKGSRQYGTWTGIITPKERGVHTVETVLLQSGNSTKRYEVENRRFYVEQPLERNSTLRNASLQTANVDGPFFPTVLAVGIVALTVTAWITARRLHNFLDRA